MMGQLVFGLVAGIVVGLVMEWVIDWAGLLPRKSPGGTQDRSAAKKSGKSTAPRRPDADTPIRASSSQSNME
jgi:hypothetical protein